MKEKELSADELAQRAQEAAKEIMSLIEPVFAGNKYDLAEIFAAMIQIATAITAEITVPDENGSKRGRIEKIVNRLVQAALNDMEIH